MMQQYFYQLFDHGSASLKANDVLLASWSGEDSDFCRMNNGKVRQAGSVRQATVALTLIQGKRHARGETTMALEQSADRERIDALLGTLREQLVELPEDPHLLYATEVHSSERRQPNALPNSRDTVAHVLDQAKGLDLVGIYASGNIYRGFANSLGQRNWFETSSFNLDFSLYLKADKAVKTGYAGFSWNNGIFSAKLERAREDLKVLGQESRSLAPGQYRVYLAPQALNEVTDMLGWGGFSKKAHQTKQTPLLRMVESGARLNAAVTMRENTAEGLSPDFNAAGFTKPACVTLIASGAYQDSLISARSAKEYGDVTNGADAGEAPVSFEMLPGKLPAADLLRQLDTGIYVNNLWYLNYSDRPAGRITGMTRFATFWVEKGRIQAPLNVMRFDESVLRMLGDKLVGLTVEREMILSASTYGGRSTSSANLPGALIDDFSLTL